MVSRDKKWRIFFCGVFYFHRTRICGVFYFHRTRVCGVVAFVAYLIFIARAFVAYFIFVVHARVVCYAPRSRALQNLALRHSRATLQIFL